MEWQLNRVMYPVHNLGPGKRIVIWVQGCKIHCSGCLSPSLWDHERGKSVNVNALAQLLLSLPEKYDGITITGGEPFDQYEPLIDFCQIVKKYSKMDIFCYSGYYLKEIEEKFEDKRYQSYIDYLVDGRYVPEYHSNNNLYGSSNQTLYLFKNETFLELPFPDAQSTWSVNFDDTEKIYFSGVPRKGDLQSIKNHLRSKGLDIVFE